MKVKTHVKAGPDIRFPGNPPVKSNTKCFNQKGDTSMKVKTNVKAGPDVRHPGGPPVKGAIQ